MKEYFKEQLKDSVDITEDTIGLLKGKSLYGNYEVGDKVCYFMEQVIVIDDENKPIVNIKMIPICERHLDRLKNDYEFLRREGNIPILCPKLKS